MFEKETIYHSHDEFIEKIAHESAMASALSDFNSAMVKPTHEVAWIINSYYQHKRRAIAELVMKYDHQII